MNGFENRNLRPGITSKFLDDGIAAELTRYFAEILENLASLIDSYPLSDYISELDAIDEPRSYAYLPPRIHELSAEIEEKWGAAALGRYNKAVLMALIQRFDARIGLVRPPDSVVKYYPERLNCIAKGLRDIRDEDYRYTADVFRKDLKLMSFRSFPLCSRTADIDAGLSRRVLVRGDCRAIPRSLRFVYRRLGGRGPLYGTHLDIRFLDRFSAEGFREDFICIADLLRANPQVLGMIAASWLLDPQLESISPHLTLLRTLPVANGAYLWWNGTTDLDIERAITKSKSRRALYESGEYMPTSYIMVWAREDILCWADRVSREQVTDPT